MRLSTGTSITDAAPIAEDLRIRRTRNALRKALWELASRKTFQSISIQEICSLAQVNRTTFYYHFPDKYALLQYAIRETFKETVQDRIPTELEWNADSLRHLMLITWEAIEVFRIHCKMDNQQEFAFVQSTVTEILSEVLIQMFSKSRKHETLEQAPVGLVASVARWAIYGAGLYWIQEKRSESSAALIEQVLPMLLNGLH